MFELPITVNICGVDHPIRNKGDYRAILDCMAAANDSELFEEQRIVSSLAIFYDEINAMEDIFKIFNTKELMEQAIQKMNEFISHNELSGGYTCSKKVMDWEQDEMLICSAINNTAGFEVRAQPYIHWWTFLGYYLSIGECTFSIVVGIRDKINRGKKLEKWEQDFKHSNPQYFKWNTDVIKDKEAEEWVKSVWNIN